MILFAVHPHAVPTCVRGLCSLPENAIWIGKGGGEPENTIAGNADALASLGFARPRGDLLGGAHGSGNSGYRWSEVENHNALFKSSIQLG